MLSTEDVIEIPAIELLGVIPEDENIIVSTNKGVPVTLDGQSSSGVAFRNIAKRILGEDVPFMIIDQEPSLLDRAMRLVGRR